MPKATSSKPRISVIDRRLKSGAVFGLGSQAIPLTEPDRWSLRVINTQISDGRLWEIQAEKGWQYVVAADLAVSPHEIGFRDLDGHIVRGMHGQEVLMKMERRDFASVQKAKDAANRASTFGKKGIKESILRAAAQPAAEDGSGGLGGSDRGAELLDRAGLGVIDSRERVSLDE